MVAMARTQAMALVGALLVATVEQEVVQEVVQELELGLGLGQHLRLEGEVVLAAARLTNGAGVTWRT